MGWIPENPSHVLQKVPSPCAPSALMETRSQSRFPSPPSRRQTGFHWWWWVLTWRFSGSGICSGWCLWCTGGAAWWCPCQQAQRPSCLQEKQRAVLINAGCPKMDILRNQDGTGGCNSLEHGMNIQARWHNSQICYWSWHWYQRSFLHIELLK